MSQRRTDLRRANFARHKDLLDQHARNAIELAHAFRDAQHYCIWHQKCWGKIGGENGLNDLLGDMALAMTEMERRLGKDAAWDTLDLPMDCRECCKAFVATVVHVMLTTGRLPNPKLILATLLPVEEAVS